MFINLGHTKRIISLITLTAYIGTADLAFAGRTKLLPKETFQDSEEQPKRSKPLPPKEKEELSASDIEDSDQDVRRFLEEDAEVQEWVEGKRQRPQEEEQSDEDQPGMVEVLGHPVQEVGFPQFFDDHNMQQVLALSFARNLYQQPYILDRQPFYTNLALTCKSGAKIVQGARNHLKNRSLRVILHYLDRLGDGIPDVRDLGWNPFGLTFDDLFLDLQETRGRDKITIFGRLVEPVLDTDPKRYMAFVSLFPLLQQSRKSQRDLSALKNVLGNRGLWPIFFANESEPVGLSAYVEKLAQSTEDLSQVGEVGYQNIKDGCSFIIQSLLNATDFERLNANNNLLLNILSIYDNFLHQKDNVPPFVFFICECMVKCSLRSGLVKSLSLENKDLGSIGGSLVGILDISSFNQGVQLLSLLTSMKPDIVNADFFIELMYSCFNRLAVFKSEEADKLDFIAFTRVINVFNKLHDESKIVKKHRKAKKQANEFKGWDVYDVCCYIMSVPFESRTPALTTFAETVVNLPMVMNSSDSYLSFGLKKGYSWFSYLVQNAAGHDFISLVFTNFIRNMERVNDSWISNAEEFNRYVACLKKEDASFLKTDVFGKPLPFYCTKHTSLRVILEIEREGAPLFDLSERDARGNSILVEACSRNDTQGLVPFIRFILPVLKEKLPDFKKEANAAINVLKAFEGQKKGKIRDSIIEMLKEAKRG